MKKPAPAPEKFDAQQGNIISGGSELNIDGANSATVDAPLMDSPGDHMWAQKLAGLSDNIRIAPRQAQKTQISQQRRFKRNVNHVTATSNSADLNNYRSPQMGQGFFHKSGNNTICNFDQQA